MNHFRSGAAAGGTLKNYIMHKNKNKKTAIELPQKTVRGIAAVTV